MEQDFSQRELEEHFTAMGKRFDTQDDMLNALNIKVGIQNGRVSKLETKWGGVVMGTAVAVFLIGIVISLVVYSFKLSMDNLHKTIILELKSNSYEKEPL